MADLLRPGFAERDIDQAIIALKKGAYLLKYGRRGKPKFCPFRLSSDESTLIWYYGKDEKQLELRQVSRIIPGQRTAIFQRYPRPEKEYQSFSLISNDRSLDLICKDKEEAEVWFVGLKALIARSGSRRTRYEAKAESVPSDSPRARRPSPLKSHFDQDTPRAENLVQSRLGKAFADIVAYTAASKNPLLHETVSSSTSSPSGATDNPNGRCSASDTVRVSLSSGVSSSSQGSGHDDFESLGDVFIWGEGTGEGVLGGGGIRVSQVSGNKFTANTPKTVESTIVLDVQSIACGYKHAVLVTKQGEVFSWGEEAGGRLGHGVNIDLLHPKIIDTLTGINIEMVACGEYHTCALTRSGDLYTWGDGTHNCGLLGHGSDVSHWIPKKVSGFFEGLQVSYISCGPWHTAVISSTGQLFTFGDGTFGALGHGDQSSTNIPREVEALKGLRTVRVACGFWHTAAIVEVTYSPPDEGSSDGFLVGKLFTWGDGDKGQLGHGDNKRRLVPEFVGAHLDLNFSRVACGHNLTVALTTSGRVYTMGSKVHGQLGNSVADGKIPICVEGSIADCSVEDIACGSHHVAVLTSKGEVYTWGKGSNGQLGHGDNDDRSTPILVDFLKNKQAKSVVCGSNFSAAICIHKGITNIDNSVCSGCQNPFSFRRKRHNCYNCGLAFCNACSSKKSLKASLAPNPNKPYRVCDDCFSKLQKSMESGTASRVPKVKSGSALYKSHDFAEKETGGPRLLGNMSRLSSSLSFNLNEGKSTKLSMTYESNDSPPIFPLNGNVLRSSISSCKSAPGLSGPYTKFLSISVPSSRIGSCSSSPLQRKTSPLRPVTESPPVDAHKVESPGCSEHNNDVLSEEIKYLRTQVEELASKSQLLEEELERKSQQLKEATTQAADEAEKAKAAKEVIKSLTSQLKEMSERPPDQHVANNHLVSNPEEISNNPNRTSDASSVTTSLSSRSESSETSANPVLSNGTKTQMQKSELVVQDEPGVYISLTSLSGGGNELKRVRFSRRRFTEEQAAKWWSENVNKVYQRHNIRSTG